MNKATTLLLFYSNKSRSSPQMFPLYSKTQFRSIESANRSREIYRERTKPNYSPYLHSRANINTVVWYPRKRCNISRIFPKARQIQNFFVDDRQFIFLLFCSIRRRLAILSPLLLRRRSRLYEKALISDAMRFFNALNLLGTLERGSIFHLEAKRGAAHFLFFFRFFFSPLVKSGRVCYANIISWKLSRIVRRVCSIEFSFLMSRSFSAPANKVAAERQ